ncbi:hypothetical protein KA005_56040 [bacterium]|nr:hypothetical protein [bacterium]
MRNDSQIYIARIMPTPFVKYQIKIKFIKPIGYRRMNYAIVEMLYVDLIQLIPDVEIICLDHKIIFAASFRNR